MKAICKSGKEELHELKKKREVMGARADAAGMKSSKVYSEALMLHMRIRWCVRVHFKAHPAHRSSRTTYNKLRC